MKALILAAAVLVLDAAAAAAVEPCPDDAGPRAAVMAYLTAMHERRFADAYDFVTDAMTDGRAREAWAALQAQAFAPARVDIYGVDVRRAFALDGDPGCAARAVVPNILSSRDRMNEHGLVEFETYEVVHDGSGWRIERQETLFDDDAVARWFPEVIFFRRDEAER